MVVISSIRCPASAFSPVSYNFSTALKNSLAFVVSGKPLNRCSGMDLFIVRRLRRLDFSHCA
uniref:Uncharacterized protein n=1 Tax=Cannabis sativa TaxID=3483 RepID=A0A803RCM2_CANSA